jgi:S-adenosylmethionine:tRNA ribosyltransferase-isomerase
LIALEDLDYALPPERIAQEPVRPRDGARLLVVERASGKLEQTRFGDLALRVGRDDLLVVNDTRVVPAKLRGQRATGGRVEALLLSRRPDDAWTALVRGRVRPGTALELAGARATVEEVLREGACVLRFDLAPDGLHALLERLGEAPLPPYIERESPRKSDLDDYQTVFARAPGAVAAPTAGLHFTAELAARLRMASVTLHVGPGTFRPIRAARLADHAIEPERFEVPEETAAAIAACRARGGRVIAIGTTVVRALETTGGAPGSGETSLAIYPGHAFRAVDELVTNFHLPRSTLLALVMAFAGVDRTRQAYAHALDNGFRFYSYGDAMWIR